MKVFTTKAQRSKGRAGHKFRGQNYKFIFMGGRIGWADQKEVTDVDALGERRARGGDERFRGDSWKE